MGDHEQAKIQQVKLEKVMSAAAVPPKGEMAETLVVDLSPDYLQSESDTWRTARCDVAGWGQPAGA